MTIDTTDWKKLPWWRAVRRVYEIPDVVSDRNAAEIVALELAGHLEPISNETEWGEALTSAESTIAALVKAGSAGELDHGALRFRTSDIRSEGRSVRVQRERRRGRCDSG